MLPLSRQPRINDHFTAYNCCSSSAEILNRCAYNLRAVAVASWTSSQRCISAPPLPPSIPRSFRVRTKVTAGTRQRTPSRVRGGVAKTASNYGPIGNGKKVEMKRNAHNRTRRTHPHPEVDTLAASSLEGVKRMSGPGGRGAVPEGDARFLHEI